MSELLPDGDDVRRAIKWVSRHVQEGNGQQLQVLVQEATFKFDLSPLDAEFLNRFFLKKDVEP